MKKQKYQLRVNDFIFPVGGYIQYLDRNWETLVRKTDEEHYWKATGRSIGLAVYHFMLLPGTVLTTALKLEEFLR